MCRICNYFFFFRVLQYWFYVFLNNTCLNNMYLILKIKSTLIASCSMLRLGSCFNTVKHFINIFPTDTTFSTGLIPHTDLLRSEIGSYRSYKLFKIYVNLFKFCTLSSFPHIIFLLSFIKSFLRVVFILL